VIRLIIPDFVAGGTVTIVAAIGIVINAATALMFARGRKQDLNVRGAYLHMIADALVSAGVVIAGIAIAATGWLWIDPVTSLIVASLIFLATATMLRDSLTMAMAGVPPGIDPDEVEAHLTALPGVAHIHDLHIWPMSTTEYALTAHLVIPGGFPGDEFLRQCSDGIAHHFGITHSTFQVEIGADCALQPAERV
jgi:cobalt-zinc-cadmium efflux system protein